MRGGNTIPTPNEAIARQTSGIVAREIQNFNLENKIIKNQTVTFLHIPDVCVGLSEMVICRSLHFLLWPAQRFQMLSVGVQVDE